VTRTAVRGTRRTLGRPDWIEAGQQLLISGGLVAVTLGALTRELGVTSGSFYHHFSDFRHYLEALADYYSEENVERIDQAWDAHAVRIAPAERLRQLHALREQWDIARLDRAMRVWATSDERARSAVARLDDKLIEMIRATFSELGFSYEQARIRALLAFSAGVGQPFLFGRPASAQDAAAALELLIDRTV
jgi:AcrR family transcriptional regulator